MATPSDEQLGDVDAIHFRGEAGDVAEDLDMTPMVDVTFLLLIFFMVTAVFSLQKSIEVPTPKPDEKTEQARTLEDIETDDDYIVVRVYRDNTIWVEGQKAPSEQDLLVKLRDARQGTMGGPGPTKLLVLADPEARHETVVRALDAGNAVGMEGLRLATASELDF